MWRWSNKFIKLNFNDNISTPSLLGEGPGVGFFAVKQDFSKGNKP
jgi:hypothetical protein